MCCLQSSATIGFTRRTKLVIDVIDDPNDFVHIEIRAALDRDVPVIPVLVEGVKMARDRDLPESLRAVAFRNAISVRSDPDFHNDMERLCRALTSELRKSSRLPRWPIRVSVAVVASMIFLLALGVAAYYFLTSAKRLEPVAPTRPDAVREVEEKKALLAAVGANSTEAAVATSAPDWLPLSIPAPNPKGSPSLSTRRPASGLAVTFSGPLTRSSRCTISTRTR